MIGRGMLILLAALPAAADATPQRTTAAQVIVAAARCGLPDFRVRRDGPRRFVVERGSTETTVIVAQGPLPPERERAFQAAAEAQTRSLNCLLRWARQRRVSIVWEVPMPTVF